MSRHLRVLRDSGLVHDELVGRQRFYVLHPERLTEVYRTRRERRVQGRREDETA